MPFDKLFTLKSMIPERKTTIAIPYMALTISVPFTWFIVSEIEYSIPPLRSW